MRFLAKSRPYECLPLVLSSASLAGCAVGLNYKRSLVDSPPIVRGEKASKNSSFAELNCWQGWNDEPSSYEHSS